jgi:uncharacterized protein
MAVCHRTDGSLHAHSTPSFLADIDVCYFDAGDLSEKKEHARRLKNLDPALPWDVKNRAAVHLWFHEVFGYSVEPLHSMVEAVSTWPEPAVCVGVGRGRALRTRRVS